jgi:hypothetical protein
MRYVPRPSHSSRFYHSHSNYYIVLTTNYTYDTRNVTGNICINITLRRFHATIFVMEKQEVLHSVSVCL